MKLKVNVLLKRKNIRKLRTNLTSLRGFADDCGAAALNKKGLILGAYEGCCPGEHKFTDKAAEYDQSIGGKLCNLLKGIYLKAGEARVFKNLDRSYYAVGVAALGKENYEYNDAEDLIVSKENIRIAAGLAARIMHSEGTGFITIEEFSSPEAASEAGYLATWKYDELKNKDEQGPKVKLELYDSVDKDDWMRGKIKAEAQNLARRFEETPANLMTPLAFTQATIDNLCPCGIQVEVRDKDWIENKKMAAFLTVAQGSCESPLFLEVSYCGTSHDDKPIIFCGLGLTFDTGGFCLKPPNNMSVHRADLAGAAVIIAVIKACAQLALPVNIFGLIPLCENMPSGMAMRPGDVVMAMNGKTIRIESTDNEGVVILSDVISLATATHRPCNIIDIGTFELGTRKALGAGFSPCYCTSDVIWRELRRAGSETGDRFWRFPFWKYFSKQVLDFQSVDICNVGRSKTGETSLAAAFLKEFVDGAEFTHIDITGTGMMSLDDHLPYLKKGLMTGRPTRTLVQFLYQLACPHGRE